MSSHFHHSQETFIFACGNVESFPPMRPIGFPGLVSRDLVNELAPVHEIVQEGNRTAQRHRLDITTRDGATIRMEVHMFAEYASDGRLRRVHEMTRKTVTGTAR